MESIVQKAVEIGAAEIAPIISDRTVVQVDSENAAQKKTKWQQIAIEAAKQCGQNWLPRLHAPRKLADFFDAVEAEAALSDRRTGVSPAESPMSQPSLETLPELQKDIVHFDLRLIGSLQPDAQHLKKILADYSSEHRQRPQSVLMRKAISHLRNLRSLAVMGASPLRLARLFCEWKPPRFIV